jgi:hypothetical protein
MEVALEEEPMLGFCEDDDKHLEFHNKNKIK